MDNSSIRRDYEQLNVMRAGTVGGGGGGSIMIAGCTGPRHVSDIAKANNEIVFEDVENRVL